MNNKKMFQIHDSNTKKIVEFHTYGNFVQYRAYNEDATLNSVDEISFQMKQGDKYFPEYSIFFVVFDGLLHNIEIHVARSLYRTLMQNGFAA